MAAKGGAASGSIYYEIGNFSVGMDLRKSPLTAPAGSLQMLSNADITPGGEIEKRAAFVPWCQAPAGSIGLCTLNDQVYTHILSDSQGGVITPPTDTSVGIIYIGEPCSIITIVAQISGTTMTVQDTSAPLGPGNQILGSNVPAGTEIVSGSGSQANVPFTVQVNIAQTTFPSSVVGGPIAGATPFQFQLDATVFNGKIYAVFLGADNLNYHYYNGVSVSQATGRGYMVRTYKEKMYGVEGRNLWFSAIGDPTIWMQDSPDSSGVVTSNHSGYINMGAQDADSENLTSMEVYYDKLALFSNLSCQLWFLDPDETKNQYYQTVRDAGTVAPRSALQYIASDVYFLGNHGIRSLRARDLTMTAAVADVGSPLDPLIQSILATTGPGGIYWQTKTLLSPRTGRIWMTFNDRVYILSNWASPNIAAWSVYMMQYTDAGGVLHNFQIDIQGTVFADPYVVIRDTNGQIYRFGSTGAPIYDSSPVQVLTPFLSFDKPTTYKFYQAFDAICSNTPGSTWNVQASFDPTVTPTPYDQIAVLDGPTVMHGRIPISGRGTHIQLNITHQAPGPATLSKVFVHYAPSDTE